ncbi:MAG: PqqD family protein [Bacilli bacterium]
MKINEDYLIKKIAGETILVHQNKNNISFSKVITLNETAAFLFGLLKEGKNEAELLSCLTDEYDISPENAQADIHEFIEKLKELKIAND